MFKQSFFSGLSLGLSLGLLLGVAGLAANAESLDWIRVGPSGGVVRFLTVNPTNANQVWTGLQNVPQSYRSENRGTTWEVAPSAPAGIHLLVYDPFQTTKIYAAVAHQTPGGLPGWMPVASVI
jgi:hypothetical protein